MTSSDFVMPDASVGADKAYNDGLKAGKFMIQRSKGTGAYVFFPRVLAPGTGADDLEWVEASGNATVYASTIIRRPEKFGGDYNNVLIELEEGPRLFSRIVDVNNDDITIGMRVKAIVGVPPFGKNAKTETPVVYFTPA